MALSIQSYIYFKDQAIESQGFSTHNTGLLHFLSKSLLICANLWEKNLIRADSKNPGRCSGSFLYQHRNRIKHRTCGRQLIQVGNILNR
jgi:ribosomal protein S27AE